jgi:hypothetical protein
MTRNRFGRLLPLLAATVMSTAIFPASANAGTVGVTGAIQGAGSITSVEGGPYSCSKTNNYSDDAVSNCDRQTFEAWAEAWVWLRPAPADFPSGNSEWAFSHWEGCDETRYRNGRTECAVHSGCCSLDERSPKAVFYDFGHPDVSIASGPAHGSRTTSTSATFTFSSTDTFAGFRCQFDSESTFTQCNSGWTKHGLAQGSHTLSVYAIDPSGNQSTSTIVRAWTVDSVAPITRITGGFANGTRTNSTSARFTFSANEPSRFLCRLDNAAYSSCSATGVTTGASPTYASLRPGQHTFFVYANDGLQNGPVAATTWTIDTEPPETLISGGPDDGSTTTDTSATFTFSSAAGDVAGYQCSLDGAAYASCPSSYTLTGLSQETHTLRVLARDTAGNLETTPAERTWTVTAPPSDDGSGGTSTPPPSGEVASTGTVAPTVAAPPPTIHPAALDVMSPLVTLFRANRHRLRKTKTLAFTITASELSTLVAAAKIGSRGLGKVTTILAAGGRTTVHIKLSRTAQAALRKALARKRTVAVVVTLALTDAAGNAATVTHRVTVVG